MENEFGQSSSGSLNDPESHSFLINHLNRIYCVKAHLYERLPDVYAHVPNDLDSLIAEALVKIKQQLTGIDRIFSLLNSKYEFEHCESLICLIEDLFCSIHRYRDNSSIRALSLLFYLENIKSIEFASIHILRSVADLCGRKEIKQLLLEHFKDARKDLILLTHLSATYLGA
ncbi:DUF892 family protein [Mucilaginibacter phyllosphaerae]